MVKIFAFLDLEQISVDFEIEHFETGSIDTLFYHRNTAFNTDYILALNLQLKEKSYEVLYIAILGLAVNGYGLYALKSELKDINIRGSFLHLLTDTLGSLGVIISSLVVAYTHFYQMDALAIVAIGVLVAYPTYFLIKDSLHILMEGAPQNIDLDDIKNFISNDFNGKAEHVHIWALTPDKTIMVVRIRTSGKAEVGSLKSALKSRFGFCDVFLETDEEN